MGAKGRLAEAPFELSEAQAEAVLGLQLGRLTNLDQTKLEGEHTDLEAEIVTLTNLMEGEYQRLIYIVRTCGALTLVLDSYHHRPDGPNPPPSHHPPTTLPPPSPHPPPHSLAGI